MSTKAPTNPQHLAAYRGKRRAVATPEPFGSAADSAPLSSVGFFVVQLHAARQRHFDLRLNLNGVLKSWAVPKGPSMSPKDMRLAIHVEDHPIAYGFFEGVIPPGNYGAGAVVLWDIGTLRLIPGAGHGLEDGKLLFELGGYRLRGRFQLLRTKAPANGWLLNKKPDAFARETSLPETSILSGLTPEEIHAGPRCQESVRGALTQAPGGTRAPPILAVDLMLARAFAAPFDDPGWLFEIKYDGFRLLAAKQDGTPTLRFRRGGSATALFPEIVRAVGSLPWNGILCDGEVVVRGETGAPSFALLQQRVQLRRQQDIHRASIIHPATLYVFDILGLEDRDLRPLPTVARKDILAQIAPHAGPVCYCEHIVGRGREFFAGAQKLSIEGMVAKRASAPYRGGRSDAWRKIKVARQATCIIIGYSLPKRARVGIGALLLACHDEGAFVYVGRVGTGFTTKTLTHLARVLGTRLRSAACCTGAPGANDLRWVDPDMACRIRYREITDDGLLRHAVFVAIEEGVAPETCSVSQLAKRVQDPVDGLPQTPQPEPHNVAFTHLDKVFWPQEGYTKGDLIAYYRTVAPWILPYLRDRPVVLTRYPDGIDGKSFFQKDAPAWCPGWVRTEMMYSDEASRDIRHFVCDSSEALAYIANMGAIPLHVWGSRLPTLGQPDWCILDLDPKQAPFSHVVTIAQAILALCNEVHLPTYLKTSGASGLHVLIPLGRRCTFAQSQQLGELLARLIAAELPNIATIARTLHKREGKVYIDYLQNGHGRLLVAPYAVRPLAGAPVSTPLHWHELHHDVDVGAWTIKTIPQRLATLSRCPMRRILTDAPDFAAILQTLGRRIGLQRPHP